MPGSADAPVRPLVTLTLWGVDGRRIPAAVARMALDRRHLRRTPGLLFARLLGTGDGRTFTLRDADPFHWGLLAVWDGAGARDGFAGGTTERAWARISTERLTVRMAPLTSHGLWSGRQPFGDPAPRRDGALQGPVAAITRARLRWRRIRSFWAAVPAVSADLRECTGLQLAVGIGEAPIGLQGTFSLWRDASSLTAFAHRRTPHRQVVARAAAEGWYAEELFARFEVLSVEGTFGGRGLEQTS
jgi:hypothetical protein